MNGCPTPCLPPTPTLTRAFSHFTDPFAAAGALVPQRTRDEGSKAKRLLPRPLSPMFPWRHSWDFLARQRFLPKQRGGGVQNADSCASPKTDAGQSCEEGEGRCAVDGAPPREERQGSKSSGWFIPLDVVDCRGRRIRPVGLGYGRRRGPAPRHPGGWFHRGHRRRGGVGCGPADGRHEGLEGQGGAVCQAGLVGRGFAFGGEGRGGAGCVRLVSCVASVSC